MQFAFRSPDRLFDPTEVFLDGELVARFSFDRVGPGRTAGKFVNLASTNVADLRRYKSAGAVRRDIEALLAATA